MRVEAAPFFTSNHLLILRMMDPVSKMSIIPSRKDTEMKIKNKSLTKPSFTNHLVSSILTMMGTMEVLMNLTVDSLIAIERLSPVIVSVYSNFEKALTTNFRPILTTLMMIEIPALKRALNLLVSLRPSL